MARKPTPRAASDNPVTYTAPHDVYTGGVYYPAGKPFTTSEPKGAEWEEADPTARAAAIAADPLEHSDVDLEKLDLSALKALAASKGVDLGDAKSADDIKALIRAARPTPAL